MGSFFFLVVSLRPTSYFDLNVTSRSVSYSKPVKAYHGQRIIGEPTEVDMLPLIQGLLYTLCQEWFIPWYINQMIQECLVLELCNSS